MSVIEGLAAVLLVLGSVLVLRAVFLADRAEEGAHGLRTSPQEPKTPSLRRAA